MKVLEQSAKEILEGCKVKGSIWYFASSFEEGLTNCVKQFSETSKDAPEKLIHCRPMKFRALYGEKSLEELASIKAHNAHGSLIVISKRLFPVRKVNKCQT